MFRTTLRLPVAKAANPSESPTSMSTKAMPAPVALIPFIRYSTHSTPFPPLIALIDYCCGIDFRGEIDKIYLTRLLDTMQSEFKRYRARKGEGFARIKDEIVGYLNFALVNLEEATENRLFSKVISKIHGIDRLFSDALTDFLKSTRSEEKMAEDGEAGAEDMVVIPGAAGGAGSAADGVEAMVEIKYKLNEVGRKLLTAIKNNKVDEVRAFLSHKPELAIEGNDELTILSDAAFNGQVDILKLVVEALNKLASVGRLPSDYYGGLVGKGRYNKLPAVLWAAVNGQYDALQYLSSIEDVKTSLNLTDLEDVIAEVAELHEAAKKPNPYKAISGFLLTLHSQLSASTLDRGSLIKAKSGVALSVVQHLKKAIRAGNVEKVRELLMADASIAAYSTSRYSILSEATRFGNLEMVKLVVASLPLDYDYGQFLGASIASRQSAVLLAALAGQIDSLQYLFSIPSVLALIAPRDILSVIKKLDYFLSGEEDEAALEDYGWLINFEISKDVFVKILDFLKDFYFKEMARAEIRTSSRERYLASSVPGRGMLLFDHPPLVGGKRKFAVIETIGGAPGL